MKKERILRVLYIVFIILLNNSIISQTVIVEKNTAWSYYDINSLPNDWYKTAHTDWKKGVTPIGYGDSKVFTEIYYGEDVDNKDITKYFEKKISLRDFSKFIGFEINFQRDDGMVLYINGKEAYRNNMPKGEINSESTARNLIDREREKVFHTKVLQRDLFKEGENILSVEIHQYSETSSDCLFNFELIGHTEIKTLSNVLDKQILSKKPFTKKINQITSQLQIERASLRIDLLKSTNENLRYTLFIVGILFILSLIGYFFMLNYQEKKQKANNRNFMKLKNLNFDKEKELMSLSMRLLHNRQYFKEIKSDIKGIKTDDKSAVKSMIQQIDFLLDKNKDWDVLEKHFNEVHSGFYDNIIKKHPSLTDTELRHCMFIKLHMQTKEIARILLIDPRSVQTARYRIKKKMNLDEKKDLRDYLLNF